MKWLSSFQEPWNDRITIVITRRPGHRQHDRTRRSGSVPAPSIRACSSTLTGIDSKKFFMMKTPAASTSSGRISARVGVVDAELG